MTEEQSAEDAAIEDVEGHEAKVQVQRPILYLDEAGKSLDDDNEDEDQL